MIASPNLCSKRWVVEQYDRIVMGNSVLAWPEDAGVVRLSEETGLGIALATDGNGRYTRLDPYAGAQLALAEAYRNVAATGATPIAVTNCLNFGSPEDPEVMWQFAEATRGLAEACTVLETPVTGGNVSFYNSTAGTPINPTPVVGVLGLIDDVARRTPMGFARAGEAILLLGDTRDELGGSEWAWSQHQHLGGRPPQVDLAREQALARVLIAGSRDGLLTSAHDLSDGGLGSGPGRVGSVQGRRCRDRLACRAFRVRPAVQRVGRAGRSSASPLSRSRRSSSCAPQRPCRSRGSAAPVVTSSRSRAC